MSVIKKYFLIKYVCPRTKSFVLFPIVSLIAKYEGRAKCLTATVSAYDRIEDLVKGREDNFLVDTANVITESFH